MINEVTLKEQVEGGYIALTEDDEECFVNAVVVSKNGLRVGDKLIGALVPHRFKRDCKYYAEWVVPARYVTKQEIDEALQTVVDGWAVRASDIGLHAGDILYHAGKVQKIIAFSKANEIDVGNHVVYTTCADEVIGAMTEDDES